MVYRPCPGRIRATGGMEPDFQAFQGSLFARSTSHAWEAHLWAVFRHYVLAMSGTLPVAAGMQCSGGVGATAVMQPDFQAFVVVSGTRCVGHVQDVVGMQPDFQVLLGHVKDALGPRQGRNLIFRQCPGRVRVATRMQPDFQALLGNFLDTVCRPCPGCVVRGHGVLAMSGIRPGRDRDVA
ncbi:Hypothetical predicted protein [Olea europaea subsp. europaea]|uniref:Uncharacterized protein n=1 Tax=Olea europaea subsp. europaea TaxID=158383 RepID=A0A8S0S064_OLEEU|nr:Hypothetical predicted protein [Olea europaea subsp. europaea]